LDRAGALAVDTRFARIARFLVIGALVPHKAQFRAAGGIGIPVLPNGRIVRQSSPHFVSIIMMTGQVNGKRYSKSIIVAEVNTAAIPETQADVILVLGYLNTCLNGVLLSLCIYNTGNALRPGLPGIGIGIHGITRPANGQLAAE
jgi:hypothetical protein